MGEAARLFRFRRASSSLTDPSMDQPARGPANSAHPYLPRISSFAEYQLAFIRMKREGCAMRPTCRLWLVGTLALMAALYVIAAPVAAQQAAPAAPATAAPQPKIDSGDTAWLLTSSALVLLMTAPGLALFYGGMVRPKNALGTIMQSFIIMALISVQWVLWGYSLAFGPDKGGIIGGLEWLGLRGVGLDPGPYSDTVPHQAYMVFQLMFAIITPALITGAFAERMKFSTFIVFTLSWATLVYDPLAHWVWGKIGRAR